MWEEPEGAIQPRLMNGFFFTKKRNGQSAAFLIPMRVVMTTFPSGTASP